MKQLGMPLRPTAWLLAAAISSAPLAACGKNDPPPPVDDTRGGRAVPTQPKADSPGMSGTQKVVLLAGAAALYYLYKKHQNAAAKEGPEGQYYLSKNGRVYYRDAEHRAHWVTPPPDGIKVPESEANEYRGFQGFNNSTTGRDLTGLGADPE
jgi:hypothetical protein